MLINTDYFTDGILRIEGVSKKKEAVNMSEAQKAAETGYALSGFIDTYVPEYIEYMLGEKVGSEFMDYLASEPPVITPEWEVIREWFIGKKEFSGVSPAACYVFFMYVRQNQARATTSVGVVFIRNDNPVVEPAVPLISVWNKMVKINLKFAQWMEARASVYPGWNIENGVLETMNQFGI
ncbi:hypothetical protein EZS27_003882 [termite gut metagenome]|uniref:Uncharacterized protein n=1 Tax=termite gut metagenome TaxID=433724 RepID=A0A5J4SQY0_9ZZZZ